MLRTCLRSASIFLLFSTFAISRSGAQLPLDAWEDSTSSLTNFHVDSTSDHYILDSLLEPFSTASVLEEGGIDGSTSDDIVHLYPYPSSSDDLFEHDLLLGLNDDCYFDASFADPGSVNLFIKRASEGACKTPTRDSTQPSRPDNDPNDFLNSLPIFEPEPGSEFHENLEVCPPLLVGEGRKFPVCRQGHSALAEKYDDVYAQGDRHDCAPYIPGFGCTTPVEIYCCKSVLLWKGLNEHLATDYMIQPDNAFNVDQCRTMGCVLIDGPGLTPDRPEEFFPSAPSQTPS